MRNVRARVATPARISVPRYSLTVYRDGARSPATVTELDLDVDAASRLLDGPVVYVAAYMWERVGNSMVEVGWSIGVVAFIEAEAEEALEAAWQGLAADIERGHVLRGAHSQPVPRLDG